VQIWANVMAKWIFNFTSEDTVLKYKTYLIA